MSEWRAPSKVAREKAPDPNGVAISGIDPRAASELEDDLKRAEDMIEQNAGSVPRAPSTSTLALLMAESLRQRGVRIVDRDGNQSSSGALQARCRCGHARGAHDGADEMGACQSKFCRKLRRCLKFEVPP